MAPTLALAGIGYLAQSFVFARVLGAFQAVTPAQGIEAGFLVWVGFLLPVSVTLTALSKERQWTVLWIHTSFQLLCSMILGVILVGLR
jgi:Fe2+ transport system protein B